MSISDYFALARAEIAANISAEITETAEGAAAFSGDSARIFDILEKYALSGKMLRGCLACLGGELFEGGFPETRPLSAPPRGGARSPALLRLAAALELFQAGLLVHDDIMDKDELRRGAPTMHKVFEASEARHGASEARQTGEAIGICAGDIYYFIAWKIITSISPQLGQRFASELVDVCLAQIRDVRFGARAAFPPLPDILEVYAYKTARYTISLPLGAGAALAGREDALPALEELGMALGTLFQIQDDYLGLFGDERALGKPIGSDIREGKKTPFMALLSPKLSQADRRRFDGIFGREDIGREEVDCVRDFVARYGVKDEVRSLAETYAAESRRLLAALPSRVSGISSPALALLGEFIDYSLQRTS